MKNILLITAFLITAIFSQAQDSKSQSGTAVENKNAPEFKFDIETYDFGTIKQGEKVIYNFSFVNSGKEPLIITSAQGSCGCTVPKWPKEPIAKGAKGSINVEYNSTGKMGMQNVTITISSNAGSGQKVLNLKGNVESQPSAPSTEPLPDKKQ